MLPFKQVSDLVDCFQVLSLHCTSFLPFLLSYPFFPSFLPLVRVKLLTYLTSVALLASLLAFLAFLAFPLDPSISACYLSLPLSSFPFPLSLSYIKTGKERFMVTLQSTMVIDSPVWVNGELVADKKYPSLSILILPLFFPFNFFLFSFFI